MNGVADLERARLACRRGAWAEAHVLLCELDAVGALAVDDLEALAETADMLGRGDDTVHALQRAFHAHVDAGEPRRAIRCGFWLCKALAFAGKFAQAGAWQARAARVLSADPACPERGYLLMLDAERLSRGGREAEALAVARQLFDLCAEGADRDLAAAAAMTLGVTLITHGDVGRGLELLDEAMVGATRGDLSPRATGMVYCVVIGACQELHDVRRAREWTSELDEWCSAQPDFSGAYRGLCRVHRVAILELGGAWSTAVREARLACEEMTGGYGEVVAGAAFYRLAELHRLRGELDDSGRAYGRAVHLGADPQPGLALLRLVQGRRGDASSAIRRALAETTDRLRRSRLLPAAVEVLLAAGDLTAAQSASAELVTLADEYGSAALDAMSAHAMGAVTLAEDDADAALTSLRRALRLWRDLDAPYQAARARVLVARACRALHDEDTAAMELDAARDVFAHLGAMPDLATVDALLGRHADPSGLSPREAEVLRLVARGKTNQAIADELFLSEKTVARHLSNIFTKLGVGSRTAAAAYAFERGLR